MIMVIHCEVCQEPARLYGISIPNKNRKECEKCGHSHYPYQITYSFCNLKCMFEWLDSFIQSSTLEEASI